jgi:hypothetical protein
LHAVRRHHRHKFELHAQLLGDGGRHVGLEADDLAARIAKTERLVVSFDADHESPLLLDLV